MTTLAAWIVYALVVSALFALAAATAEAALRAAGRSARGVWLAAMVLSSALPVGVWLRPASWEAGAMPLPAAGFIPLAPVGVVAPAGPGIVSIDAVVAVVWLVLTGAVSFWITAGMVRLLESRKRWRRSVVWGESVWVTRDIGPAVFGVGRGEIVMPGWALDLDHRVQRLMLMHEREHLRAGDVRLAAAGLLLLVMFPWNVALWWQFRRLREAVEVDCDRRVLARDPDAHAYGSLLIEVGRRRSMPRLALAFAEPPSFLERRLRLITQRAVRHGRRAALFGGSALLVAIIAVCTRDPLAPRSAADARPPESAAAPGQLMERPMFTPFTRAPRLVNADETNAALRSNYPPLLRDAGIGGEAVLWFFIDERGVVQKLQLQKSSGYPALDEAATRTAAVMRFSPAFNRNVATSVWVQIPIRFSPTRPDTTAATERVRENLAQVDRAMTAPREPGQDPTFTPFTTAPRLLNASDVARALESSYPPLLRDAGIGGEVVLWFLLDEEGAVRQVRIARSSGYPALDEAALRVARSMRYSPAENRDRRVAVWIQIPIKFATK